MKGIVSNNSLGSPESCRRVLTSQRMSRTCYLFGYTFCEAMLPRKLMALCPLGSWAPHIARVFAEFFMVRTVTRHSERSSPVTSIRSIPGP